MRGGPMRSQARWLAAMVATAAAAVAWAHLWMSPAAAAGPQLAVLSPTATSRVTAFAGHGMSFGLDGGPSLPRVCVRYQYSSEPSTAGSTRVTLTLLRDGAAIARCGPFWVPDGTATTRTDAVTHVTSLDPGLCDLVVTVASSDGAVTMSQPDAVCLDGGYPGGLVIQDVGDDLVFDGDWMCEDETTVLVGGIAEPGETVRLFISSEPATLGSSETVVDETVAVTTDEFDSNWLIPVHLPAGRHLLYADVRRGSDRYVSAVLTAEVSRLYDKGAHVADLSGRDLTLDIDANSNGAVRSMKHMAGHFRLGQEAFAGALALQVRAPYSWVDLSFVSRNRSVDSLSLEGRGPMYELQDRLAIDSSAYIRRTYTYYAMDQYMKVTERFANPSLSPRTFKATYDSTSAAGGSAAWLASFRSRPMRVSSSDIVLTPPVGPGFLVSCDTGVAFGRVVGGSGNRIRPASARPVEFFAWRRGPQAIRLRGGGRSRLGYAVGTPAAGSRDVQLYVGATETTKQAVALARRLTIAPHARISVAPALATRGSLVTIRGHVFPPYPGTEVPIVAGPSVTKLRIIKTVKPDQEGRFAFRRRLYSKTLFYVWWQDPYSGKEIFSNIAWARLRR